MENLKQKSIKKKGLVISQRLAIARLGKDDISKIMALRLSNELDTLVREYKQAATKSNRG